jgi:hypothetical protein
MAPLKTGVAALTFLTAGLFAHDVGAQQCRRWAQTAHTAEIEHDAIQEASGLAASRQNPGLLWTHNDSGDTARLFAVQPDGTHAAEVDVAADAVDWEDMARGPCEAGSDETCLFIGDIGDNRRARERVVIYKLREPKLPDQRPASLSVDEVEAIWFRYPNGPRDAEALMVHPKTAELYVVEKNSNSDNLVFRIPHKAAPPEQPHTAEIAGHITVGRLPGLGTAVTAADFSPDGAEFTVRTYLMVYTFCIDDSFEAALKTRPVPSRPPVMVQGEAVAYDTDGAVLWLTSEGRPAPLLRMKRD